MRWNTTVSSKCRYGEEAGKIWDSWDILWEDSEHDYQGHVAFLAQKGNEYCFYEYSYGSCSGCDDWENRSLSDEKIIEEMKRDALWFSDIRILLKYFEQILLKNAEDFADKKTITIERAVDIFKYTKSYDLRLTRLTEIAKWYDQNKDKKG